MCNVCSRAKLVPEEVFAANCRMPSCKEYIKGEFDSMTIDSNFTMKTNLLRRQADDSVDFPELTVFHTGCLRRGMLRMQMRRICVEQNGHIHGAPALLMMGQLT